MLKKVGVGSLDEATDVAVVLRSGSLPISLRVDEVRSIGPTLGQDSINAGTTAAIIGGGAVIVAVLCILRLFTPVCVSAPIHKPVIQLIHFAK